MNTGGAETFLMKIYRKLDRTEYQMDFCVNVDQPSFYDDEIRELGGKIYYVPPKSSNYRQYAEGLRRIIKENKYENVLRITSNGLGFLDCKIAKSAGVKKCIVRSSNSADAEGLYALIAHRVGRMLFSKYIDVKIAPSDLAAKYTFGNRAYRKGEVQILHNGLDLDAFAFDKDARQTIRDKLSVYEDNVLLGHIGRFMKQKNHSFLIDVFSDYIKLNPKAKLLLVGDGEELTVIRKLVTEKNLDNDVIFLGIRDDIPVLMSAMDAVLLPSLYEGMPNVVIEAQANGLPCIISDTITRDANVTGLVHYLPITDGTSKWSEKINSVVGRERVPTKEIMTEKGYSIMTVLLEFERFCLSD